ncbi:hypothetical protein ACIA8O_16610 [Kitasatospora sp. NPDC051853]|uniref:hypothetical protein n=1 Tax=Kitasatospora sp. NPDC051853 TaxID=3364058 RepID=UPI0037A20254
MPTGPAHDRIVNSFSDGVPDQKVHPCRCTIGENHSEGAWYSEDLEEDADSGGLAPDVAEEIWLSNGMDEDYDFR